MVRLTAPGIQESVTRKLVSTKCAFSAGAPLALILLSAFLISCGSSKVTLPPQIAPNIAGEWEFVAMSQNGETTGIEVSLAEGQVLNGDLMVPSGQVSASSAQIAFVSLAPVLTTNVPGNMNITGFGGSCDAIATTANSLGPGVVTGVGQPVTLTFTANGSIFNVTGSLSGDGKSVLNGTYTAQSGNTCSDPGGTITGSVVSINTGTYTGHLCPLADTTSCSSKSDSVSGGVTVKSGQITLDLNLTGTDSTTFTLAGPVTGYAFSVQGTYQGQVQTYYGYFELAGSSGTPSLYLVNAADDCFSNSSASCSTSTVLALQPNI